MNLLKIRRKNYSENRRIVDNKQRELKLTPFIHVVRTNSGDKTNTPVTLSSDPDNMLELDDQGNLLSLLKWTSHQW